MWLLLVYIKAGILKGSILIVYRLGSYIAEFNMPTYLGLCPSFLVFFLIPRPKGLRAFYKQLAATTLTGNFTILLGIL